MKIKYDRTKGQRLTSRFHGVVIEGGVCNFWWDEVDRKWRTIDECNKLGHSFRNLSPCRTVKAFKRHIRRHQPYIGKGLFRLSSFYVGYDVCT